MFTNKMKKLRFKHFFLLKITISQLLELTSHEKEYDITNHFQFYTPFEFTSHEKEYKNVLSKTSCNYNTV